MNKVFAIDKKIMHPKNTYIQQNRKIGEQKDGQV